MNWLNAISIYSVFIPLLVGILNFKNLKSNSKAVLALVLVACIPHLATILDQSLPVALYNGYIVIDAIAWPIIFLLSLDGSAQKKLYLTLGGFSVITVISVLLWLGFTKRFYYDLVCLNSMFQVIYIALYFYNLNARDIYVNLRKLPVFWYALGLLLYTTCTFFVFLFYFKINRFYNEEGPTYLWRIHDFFNILMYGLFTYGFTIKRPEHVSRP
jgi:hypothetical protein